MFIQLQKSLIDSIRQFTNLEKQQQPTDDTIAMIIGLSIAIVILFAFFIYLAYFLPWWTCYNCFFSKVVTCSNSCLDCILCYYVCPCMDRTAYGYQLEQNQKNSKVFVQDMLTTPDGCKFSFSYLHVKSKLN